MWTAISHAGTSKSQAWYCRVLSTASWDHEAEAHFIASNRCRAFFETSTMNSRRCSFATRDPSTAAWFHRASSVPDAALLRRCSMGEIGTLAGRCSSAAAPRRCAFEKMDGRSAGSAWIMSSQGSTDVMAPKICLYANVAAAWWPVKMMAVFRLRAGIHDVLFVLGQIVRCDVNQRALERRRLLVGEWSDRREGSHGTGRRCRRGRTSRGRTHAARCRLLFFSPKIVRLSSPCDVQLVRSDPAMLKAEPVARAARECSRGEKNSSATVVDRAA